MLMENYFFETDSYPVDNKVFVLVIYDIIENKKRVKLSKKLLGYGFRIQKSAFEAKLTEKKYQQLLCDLKAFESTDDSIRVYRIVGNGNVTVFGDQKETVQEDIIVV